MSVAEKLMTVDEYAKLPDDGRRTELVRGRIVEMNLPTPRHGKICARIAFLLGRFIADNDIGHILTNDAGIITERNPDTLRGADVSFYSYQRLQKGKLPAGYIAAVPELAFEVLSPSDKLPDVLAKVAEFLKAGVSAVCVVDPKEESLQVYRSEQTVEVLSREQTLKLPELHESFNVAVREFFS